MVNIDAEYTTTIAKSSVLDVKATCVYDATVGSGYARLSAAAVSRFICSRTMAMFRTC